MWICRSRAGPWRWVAVIPAVLLAIFFTAQLAALRSASAAAAFTLPQLPYHDPAPMGASLALDDAHFSSALLSQWHSVERTIGSYQPAPLPVLMRPAQLPWQDTALPRALLTVDAAQL